MWGRPVRSRVRGDLPAIKRGIFTSRPGRGFRAWVDPLRPTGYLGADTSLQGRSREYSVLSEEFPWLSRTVAFGLTFKNVGEHYPQGPREHDWHYLRLEPPATKSPAVSSIM